MRAGTIALINTKLGIELFVRNWCIFVNASENIKENTSEHRECARFHAIHSVRLVQLLR